MTSDEKKAIHDAAEKGDVEKLTALLNQDSSLIGSAYEFGWTPLHMATKTGQADAATVLLERGADVNAADEKDWTPLHWAAATGRLPLVRLLLSHGAQPTATSISGNTPADLAQRASNALTSADEYRKVLSILRSGKVSRCFVATAACGTELAPDVIRLRQFRDRVLLQTRWGRFFVKLYETISPPLAWMISRSRCARAVVRCLVVRPCRRVADAILRDREARRKSCRRAAS